MITAVVEVHAIPECLLVAVTMDSLVSQFRDLQRRARVDGYHAEMVILEDSLAGGLDNSSPIL
jgi:hypothetical protein